MSYPDDDDYCDYDIDPMDDFEPGMPDFADPGGKSALRRETRDNPRNLPI